MNSFYMSTRTSRLLMYVLLLTATVFSFTSANAQVTLVGWQTTGITTGQNFGPSPLVPTTLATNVTSSGLVRGSGITTTGSPAANAWGGLSTNETSFANALAANDFATFTVVSATGFSVSLTRIEAYNIRRSNAGSTTGQWQYQIDSNGFVDIGTPITWGASTSGTGNPQPSIDLSGITALQNVPSGSTVTFRLVVWGGSAATGTWYINQVTTSGAEDLVVTGTVNAAGAPPSLTTSVSSLTDFGNINIAANSASQSFTVDATDLVSDITVTAPAGFEVSNDDVIWSSSFTIPQGTGTLTAVPVYVRFSPLGSGPQAGSVTLTGTGVSESVSVSGTGVSSTSEDADIIAHPSFTPQANIDYTLYTESDLTETSLEVFRLLVRDGGAGIADADEVATIINSIELTCSNFANLNKVALYFGNTELAEVNAAGVMTFTGAPLLTVPDNGTFAIRVLVSFSTAVNDNAQISFTVTNAVADLAGSNFAAANAGGAASSTAGDDNRIEVIAAVLDFTTQPTTTIQNAGMSNVVVRALDANSNRDFDFVGDISITSTGTLVGSPVVVTAASGSATFSGLTHSAPGTGLTLEANASGLLSATSISFNITAPPILTFEMAAAAGDEASFASATNDPSLLSSTLIRSADLTAATNGGRFNATNWSTSGTLNNAVSYMEFTLSPIDLSTTVSVERIFVAIQRSGTGPGSIALRSSVDGFTSDLGGAQSITDNTSTQTFNFVFTQAPSALPVVYRVYMYAAESTAGSGGIGDFGGNDIEVYGAIGTLQCNDPAACNFSATSTSAVDCTYPTLYYIDADGDGFAGATETTCTPGLGYTTTVLPVTDCDDTNNAINTAAAEVSCNGIDDDCDTTIDEGDIVGCQDPIASNYNEFATCPGACTYGGSWTPGNLVALRGGNGVDNIAGSTTSTEVFLEQITPTGTTASTLPLTTAGPTRLSQASISTAEGQITRTSNGDGIVVAGYDQAPGVENVTSVGVGAARVANFVDASYGVTRLFSSTTIHSGGNIRSATKNGSNTWTAGGNQGINYAGSGTPAIISTTSTNTRVIKEVGGNLYFTTGGGTQGLYRIQNGLVTSGSNTADLVIGIASGSPYDFEFSPDGNTVYIADDRTSAAGGVYKYTFDGSTWNLVAQYTIAGFPSVSSIAVDFSTSTRTIYAVSRSATETTIVSFADNNVTGAVTATTLKTTTSATAVYRSIDFVPCNGTTWFRDADGDGFGDASNPYVDCIQPFGYVANNTDCNDAVATIYPGATEVCNTIDDDCDTSIDESCINPPANDTRAGATLLSGNTFPTCGTTNGNLVAATNSPEATSTEPSGAGQDVWYRFVAQTNGVRIQATNNSGANNLVIELQNNDGSQIIAIENETTTGNEVLVANNLVPGQTYFVAVRNFNTSNVGTFTVCIQHLAASQPNNGTTFSNLCGFIKSRFTGAALYTVTFDDGVNAPISGSNTSTQVPFSFLPGVRHNTVYSVVFTTTYNINDAAGNPTTVVVNSIPYTITILPHNLINLRAIDRCPNTRALNVFVSTDAIVCGASSYQWEAELVDEFNNPISLDGPVFVNTGSRFLRANQIPGAQAGQRYAIRVRPMFSYGAGNFAAAPQYLCIAGPANMELAEEEFVAPAQRSISANVTTDMNIYPNPNRGDVFTLRAGGLVSEQVFVRIMDISGREVFTSGFAVDGMLNATIQLPVALQSGIYMIELTDGSDRFVQRMIVE